MADEMNNTQATTTPAAPKQEVKIEDIVSKVSKATTPEAKKVDKVAQVEESINQAFITEEEFARIKDPYARQFLKSKQDTMMSGLNKKFQEIASLSKELKEAQEQLSKQTPKYDIKTKDGLKSALNDPEFVNLVQQVSQEVAPQMWEGSQEEWSVLNDSEKQIVKQMQAEINQLKQTNTRAELQSIDTRIKERYADYNPSTIDSFISDINAGKMTTEQLREFAHKGLNYEKAIERAYMLAKEEKAAEISEKKNASSFSGNMTSVECHDIPERGNATSAQHFKKIAASILAKAKERTAG